MTDPIRLDKRIADLARCSRADAQQYIENGWVTVDGAVIEEPQTLVTTQVVFLSDDAQLAAIEPATMLVHKPARFDWRRSATLVTPDTHSDLDATGTRVLQRHFDHLTAQVPLDDEASGLVVATQDGRVRRRLTEDFAAIEQEYVVEVTGVLPPYGLARIARGMTFEGRTLAPCKVSWQNEFRLRFAIKDVRAGQLHHMCHEVGLTIMAMKRIRIGRISLGKMAAGEWRYVPPGERF